MMLPVLLAVLLGAVLLVSLLSKPNIVVSSEGAEIPASWHGSIFLLKPFQALL